MFLFAREIFPSEILKQFTPLENPSRDPVARFVAAAVEELDNTHAVPFNIKAAVIDSAFPPITSKARRATRGWIIHNIRRLAPAQAPRIRIHQPRSAG